MIEFVNIVKSFKNTQVLKGVSFCIQENSVMGIIGHSGAGKSLLGRIISGFEHFDSGTLKIDNLEYTNKNSQMLKKKVGFVFQNFNLFKNLSVIENLTYAPINVNKRSKDEVFNQAESLLSRFNIQSCKNLYPEFLSGGQKQRVAIARSLMMNPKIIVMDEPTSALDPELVSEIIQLIKDLSSINITVLLITHDMRVVKYCTDRVIFLSGGKVIDNLSTTDCFQEKCSPELANFISQACL